MVANRNILSPIQSLRVKINVVTNVCRGDIKVNVKMFLSIVKELLLI